MRFLDGTEITRFELSHSSLPFIISRHCCWFFDKKIVRPLDKSHLVRKVREEDRHVGWEGVQRRELLGTGGETEAESNSRSAQLVCEGQAAFVEHEVDKGNVEGFFGKALKEGRAELAFARSTHDRHLNIAK